MSFIIQMFISVCLVNAVCKGIPLKMPDFVSPWYVMTSDPNGQNRLDINHGLGEYPVYVHVQVKSLNNPNKGFLFPAMGHITRDDDDGRAPYSGIVYLYNDVKVTISAATESNNNRGRTIYTENSQYWEGPNNQDVYTVLVRVGIWKESSFPEPGYHSSGNDYIGCGCDVNKDYTCFHEKHHNFGEYPSFVVVRTKLKRGNAEFNNFMADALGASHMAYDSVTHRQHGFVIFGFNENSIRVWTDASPSAEILIDDGYNFKESFKEGELEIMAWNATSLQADLELRVELETTFFEMELNYQLNTRHFSDGIVGIVWVEARDGNNTGFRFPGTGSMTYSKTQTARPCSYGGLVYAYTDTTLRLWKPGTVECGKLVCIADVYGGGRYSQASNNGTAVMAIWTVSQIGEPCNVSADCQFDNGECINKSCQCKTGYFASLSSCQKELSCTDDVPLLPELELRQRTNIYDSGKPVDDSRLTESWYTVENSEGQFMMPDSETMPIEYSCGASNPVFIKGRHPSVNELTEDGIEVEVAFLNDTRDYSIKIRKCDESLQYRLRPVTIRDFAFCFDSPAIQGLNEFEEAPNGIDVGSIAVRVDLHFNVRVDVEQNEQYNPFLVFSCNSDRMNSLPDNIFFTTNWFVNGDLLEAYGPTQNITNLTEQTLLDHHVSLGFNIHCGVQLSSSKTGYKTPMVLSDDIFAGIKFQSSTVVIEKGEITTISFEPTVPIGCKYQPTASSDCQKQIYIKNDESVCEHNELVTVASTSRCGTSLKTFKQHDRLDTDVYYMNITTQDNNYNDKHFFRLQLITDRLGHDIWKGYQPADVKIHITHSQTTKYRVCYSHVDPHMRTADKYYYEHQFQGEFILYRNFRHGVEVQMKTTQCNKGYAYCACAISIRAGGDVFLINLCGKSKFIGYTSCNDNGILVVKKRNEFLYEVYSPIGTLFQIKIRPHRNYPNLMNIDIHMAPKDLNSTEGLCGFYDGNKTNDLRKRASTSFHPISDLKRNHHPGFSEEWRIQDNETNYLRVNISDPVPRWEKSLFCTCNQAGDQAQTATPVCSPSMHFNCSSNDDHDAPSCLNFTQNGVNVNEMQRKSELSLTDDGTQNKVTKRSTSLRNITEEDALAICTDKLLNHPTLLEFQHRLIGMEKDPILQECAYDVSEEDDESWADVYPDALIQIIQTFNDKDPQYVEEHEDEILRFKERSCPYNCSGNGKCNTSGTCDCWTGYFGPDCSIDQATPLIIDDIYGDGVCDIGDDSCECITFQTNNLLNSFFCRINRRQVLTNGVEVYDEFILPGIYENIFNGECCVTDSTARKKRDADNKNVFTTHYNISISNDGNTFGDTRTITVYDSSCQDVGTNETQNVVLKTNTCFIDGQCVQENVTATQDSCLSCLPQSDQFVWTNNCVNIPNEGTSSRWIFIVVGCVAVLMICFGLVLIVRCISRSRKREVSVPNIPMRPSPFRANLHGQSVSNRAFTLTTKRHQNEFPWGYENNMSRTSF